MDNKKRVIIFTNKSSLFSPEIIDELVKPYEVLVVLYNRTYGARDIQKFLTPSLYKVLLNKFIIKYFKEVKGESNSGQTAKNYCLKNNVNNVELRDLNSDLCLQIVSDFKADLALLCSLSVIVDDSILEIPGNGTLNIHTSLLPNRRGPRPVFWSLYYEDECFGYTIHRATKKIDSGDIIFQESVEITQGENEYQITKRLFKKCSTNIVSVIESLLNNTSISFNRSDLPSCYNRRPTVIDSIKMHIKSK